MTGRVPHRHGLHRPPMYGEPGGLQGEATLPQILSGAGYVTQAVGKWHIGDQPETRPPARGFDESSGLMYSNDMWEHHPEAPEYWGRVPLQFWRNGEVTVERVTPEHQAMLTTWYTEQIGRAHV